MSLPTFIVIGASKCGTTSLCDLLGQHSDVFMSEPKEPNYFSRLNRFEQRRPWYESLYASANGHAARGEGSVSYTHPFRVELVAPRVFAAVPNCRLIYMVRHPIQRLESDWKMRRREGRTPANINKAVEVDATLIGFGLYWRQLSAYRRLFSSDQILVVFLEEFVLDPLGQMAKVYAHVGVDPTFRPHNAGRARNAAADKWALNGAGKFLRRVPGSRDFKRALPHPIIRVARRLLTDRRRSKPMWHPQVLHSLRELYREDSKRLLEYCGKPEDYWHLDHQFRPAM